MNPYHNYQPPRQPSRKSEAIAFVVLALMVAGLTVAFTFELAK